MTIMSARRTSAKMQLPVASEDTEQICLMRWARASSAAMPELKMLVHIANERKCTPAQGQRLREMGVRKGMPDLFLFVPRGSYHGLAVEMKRTRGGVVSDEQREMLAALEAMGYAASVARGWEQASDIISDYICGGDRWREYRA